MILIADSGSTKTDWRLCSESAAPLPFQTIGLNPFFVSPEEMRQLLSETFADYFDAVTEIYFYGAGCVPAKIPMMEDLFRQLFTHATVFVASDLLGAARAVCGREPGIACILGTGSNSCYYDGNDIVGNVSPLGFILGDEGSGAVMGRLLVADYLKHQMPEELRADFAERYDIVPTEVIERVYRQASPNRYLANFARFIAFHTDHPYIQQLVESQFLAFFRRNIMQYPQHKDLAISFIGSVAYYLGDNLAAAATTLGLKIGTVVQSPIEGLCRFHTAE